MLKSLYNIKPEIAQQVLINLTKHFLPQPFDNSLSPIEEQSLEAEVLREVKIRSHVDEYNSDQQVATKMLSLLSDELSNIILRGNRAQVAKNRLLEQNLLPSNYSQTKIIGNSSLFEIRILAKDIIDNLGNNVAYSDKNVFYPNAPFGKHLVIEELISFIVKRVERIFNRAIGFYIIEDPNMVMSINSMHTLIGDSLYIVVNDNIGFEWKRFTLVKELCSIYLSYDTIIYEKAEYLKKADYLNILNSVFEKTKNFKNFDFTNLNQFFEIDEELFSLLLAIELLIPIYDRQEINKLISRINPGDKITVYDVSKSLLIPEYIMQLYIDWNLINVPPQYIDLQT